MAQIYSPLGEEIGGQFRLNGNFNADSEQLPDLAALPGGGFVAVFTDTEVGPSDQSLIRLNEFTASGILESGATIR